MQVTVLMISNWRKALVCGWPPRGFEAWRAGSLSLSGEGQREAGTELRVPGSIRVSPFDGSTFFNRFLGASRLLKRPRILGQKMKKFKAPSLNTSNLRDPFWDDRPIPAQPLTRTPASYFYSSSPFARIPHGLARSRTPFFLIIFMSRPSSRSLRPPPLLRHVSPFSSKLSRPNADRVRPQVFSFFRSCVSAVRGSPFLPRQTSTLSPFNLLTL